MKKTLIILALFTLGFKVNGQNNTHKKYSLSFQFSHLRGIYQYSSFSANEFTPNFYAHGELNYAAGKNFSIGGFFGYTLGEERLLIEDAVQGNSYASVNSPIFIIGANAQLDFNPIYLKNFIGIDQINPYLAFEYGYLLHSQRQPDYEPYQDNTWVYTLGIGTDFYMNDKFFFRTELNYNQKFLGRLGFGWKI